MLELKSKAALASDAFKMAQGFELVRYRNVTYIPADYETLDSSQVPDIDRTIWLPLDRMAVRRLAADQFNTLFSNDTELANFDFMVSQHCIQQDKAVTSLLVRTAAGLRELDDTGKLVDASQEFRPNTLVPMLNDDKAEKKRVYDVIVEWVGSKEDAESLLYHLATALAPGWSAVKYVLLLGGGRNGKSTLLKMLTDVFGRANISSVPRQEMTEGTPMTLDLNGKLLNIIYDGQATYLKDSGREKSLIAGETVSIKELYRSLPVPVQTNALFIEGLQHEPKTNDKSSALQKRLVRFGFPNVYDLDHRFERSMRTEEALGAFLSLLIDHYVLEDDVAGKLLPTAHAIELQMEQMFANSLGLQFLKYVEENAPLGADSLIGMEVSTLARDFQSWRLKENDIGTWAEPDVLRLFQPLLNTERRSERDGNKVRKIRVVTSFKLEGTAFINSLKGTEDDDILEALVDD